jgi:pimeloyl-ACP methyl ester carboxylesterase
VLDVQQVSSATLEVMISFDELWHRKLGRPYQLHVERHGDAEKPVIVLLHGIAASGEDWNKFIPLLETEYYCITIDLLGFGKSPKPQWSAYTMVDHTRSLYHTMNKLHLGSRFILMGHSLGSFLAARYAAEHEANLERLYLLSPPVYPPLSSIEKRTARSLTGLLLRLYKFLRNEKMTPETFRRLSYLAPLPRSILRDSTTWVPFMRTLQQCIEHQTILGDVRKLGIVTEVFYGTLDQVVVRANVERLARNKQVTLHSILATHDLSTRYARNVKANLAKSQMSNAAHTSSPSRAV